MDEQLLRPLVEATYLTATNAWRYRAILRHFYIQHESMRHYLFPEEILAKLQQNAHFADYNEDQLEQDLKQLTDWGNLIARQETGRVNNIEEFRKRRFRYQASAYTIEIERMVAHLEQMGTTYGGSLERTHFDRLLAALQLFAASDSSLSGEELNARWTDLFESFRRLTENATDYLAHLYSLQTETGVDTDTFLEYKDSLSDYLRNFVAALQRSAPKIADVLQHITDAHVVTACERLADYELSIPRLDKRPPKTELVEKYTRQWRNLCIWFLGERERDSDLQFLRVATHEAIRRVTRFVQRLGERHQLQRSRRYEYLHLATRFANCATLDEAHILSASVFGLTQVRHLYAPVKDTEDIYAEVWDRPPLNLTLTPRVRSYRLKTRPNAIEERTEAKEAALAEYLRIKAAEEAILMALAQQGSLHLADLGPIEPPLRKTLLGWIARSLASSDHIAATESGRRFRLKQRPGKVTLICSDGQLLMPNYTLEFLE